MFKKNFIRLSLKLAGFLLTLLLSNLLMSSSVLADEEFVTSYQSEYQVFLDGTTRVTQKVSLTNKLANVYVKKYSFTAGSTRIKNISAHDDLGPLKIETRQLANKTEISFEFNEVITGKDEVLDFSFSFDSLDFSVKSGQIWEINLPKLANAPTFQNYQVSLITPSSFGRPASISPKVDSIREEGATIRYLFTSPLIKEKGITATFGDQQIFDFKLKYHLKNGQSYPVKTKIALPPDANFQRVYYQSIEPAPYNVEVDGDGNWLAEYHLEPEQSLEVIASGSAQMFLKPTGLVSLPDKEMKQNYLKPQEYWQINNPEIQEKAKELKTIKKIYQFVSDSLIYDYGRIEDQASRLGALGVLETPQTAICVEFTDLFVALARAAGVPARSLTGYAHTHNPQLKPLALEQDLLHNWPEYFDQEQGVWRSVDPTWENTTGGVDFFHNFDLNHFVFTIQGLSSIYPLPAGAYKFDDWLGKNVQVDFGQKVAFLSKIEAQVDLIPQSLPWQPFSGYLTVKNRGNQAIYDLKLKSQSDTVSIKKGDGQIAVLPPFSHRKISINFQIKPSFSEKEIEVVFRLADQEFKEKVIVLSIFDPLFAPYLIIFIVPSILVVLLFTLGRKVATRIVR